MKELSYSDFSESFNTIDKRVPLYGQIELTYRCPLDCVHCYCRNGPKEALDAFFWKGIDSILPLNLSPSAAFSGL